MTAWGIFYLCFGLFLAGLLVHAVWLDREPQRKRAQFRRELPKRIMEARQQVRQLFRESNRRMDQAAGKRDDFHIGPGSQW